MNNLRLLFFCSLFFSYTIVGAQVEIEQGTVQKSRDVHFNPKFPPVHDPVMGKDGDTYYVFATGNGISTLYSKDLITWKRGKPVFDSTPGWVKEALPNFKGNNIWAPDIIFYKGLYHLFYSCNATPGMPDAAIGHATNPTLNPNNPNFKWTDHGKIVQSVLNRDLWQAIDPNVIVDEDGTPWFIFGSFWDGIKAVKMTDDMMKLKWPEEWHSIARRPSTQKLYNYGLNDSQIEGAFVFKHGEYYYLFTSFDMCCRGVKSNYHIVVGRSKSVTGPYLDRSGFSMMDGGGTVVAIGDGIRWAAVGHNSVYHIGNKDYLFTHAYSIPDKGVSELVVSEIKWDSEGWPILHMPN
ncbi:MAG TPA: family 43 glycosylhydrolase [Arachidicoccus sp.]|nr:family 43 glycosylhydrolase [Arachidicoccus sp.]